MFICNECERTFDTPKILAEHHPYGMTYATEEFSYCPYCESDNFDEAKICKYCGEYVAELHNGLCEICNEDMYG